MIIESKSNYYHEFFNNNLKNSKKIWSGINDLISSKSKNKNSSIALDINGNLTSDKKLIAESFKVFYKYFKIAEKVKRNHPATKKSYRDYLDKTCRNSFFFTPTTPDEVKSIIKSLDTSKATGPYSIPHQLLNALPTEISAILSEIFNKSFKTGKFHQGYRKQSQCGILEGKDKDERIQNWFNYFK